MIIKLLQFFIQGLLRGLFFSASFLAFLAVFLLEECLMIFFLTESVFGLQAQVVKNSFCLIGILPKHVGNIGGNVSHLNTTIPNEVVLTSAVVAHANFTELVKAILSRITVV